MANNETVLMDEEALKEMVYEIRGQRAMLDFDLARVYGYQTKRFNQQIKNNIERFPEEFRFKLTQEETNKFIKSKFLTLEGQSQKGKHMKKWPHAFTEQGITRQRRI